MQDCPECGAVVVPSRHRVFEGKTLIMVRCRKCGWSDRWTEGRDGRRVESEPGRGALFSVDLPRAAEPEAEAPAPADAEPSGPGLRILVVDDEESLRRTLTRFFSRRGHQVDTAADGAEALRLLARAEQRPPYDLILSDLRMPGLGGEDLLRRLQALEEGLVERVIVISGDLSPDAERFLQAMKVPVLWKPFSLHELAERVERQGERLRTDG